MDTAQLTRPYVLHGVDGLEPSPYLPGWPDADPGQADEEAAGDPAAPAGDDDSATCVVQLGDCSATGVAVGTVAATALPFWPLQHEPTVVDRPAYAGRHTPEAVDLAWRSSEVGCWTPPRHHRRRLNRPGIAERLIGWVLHFWA